MSYNNNNSFLKSLKNSSSKINGSSKKNSSKKIRSFKNIGVSKSRKNNGVSKSRGSMSVIPSVGNDLDNSSSEWEDVLDDNDNDNNNLKLENEIIQKGLPNDIPVENNNLPQPNIIRVRDIDYQEHLDETNEFLEYAHQLLQQDSNRGARETNKFISDFGITSENIYEESKNINTQVLNDESISYEDKNIISHLVDQMRIKVQLILTSVKEGRINEEITRRENNIRQGRGNLFIIPNIRLVKSCMQEIIEILKLYEKIKNKVTEINDKKLNGINDNTNENPTDFIMFDIPKRDIKVVYKEEVEANPILVAEKAKRTVEMIIEKAKQKVEEFNNEHNFSNLVRQKFNSVDNFNNSFKEKFESFMKYLEENGDDDKQQIEKFVYSIIGISFDVNMYYNKLISTIEDVIKQENISGGKRRKIKRSKKIIKRSKNNKKRKTYKR